MADGSARRGREPSWSERGSAAVDLGDLDAARACFAEAARRERGNGRHRYDLAVVQEALGELDAAGASLTEALRLDPGMAGAARRLALLAGRCDLPGAVPLDPVGLRAALAHDTVDRELIAEMALRHLAVTGPLGDALARGRAVGWLQGARELCHTRAAPLLRDALLLDVLRTSVFRGADMERLLTALRRTLLLEVPLQRLEDRALFDFALALARQCEINEHVWSESPEEKRRLDRLGLDLPALLAGDPAQGRLLVLGALYLPLGALLGDGVGPGEAEGIRPRALREAAVRRLAEAAEERARAARMPRLGAIAEPTSRRVARQYEANPYPRWTSVGLLAPKDMRRALHRYFRKDELAFLDRPFDVLIAGCGTGQQAVQAALAYGPGARVLAIDLSAASLAYAARMAERFGARNIAFAQTDLVGLCAADARLAGRFRVIECTGVLHHLADPFQGWRTLIQCLAANGLLLLGLYSAAARRDLAALRYEPDYPGSGCSEAALRSFRQVLLDRPSGRPGGQLKMSRDFYSASNFRDLALHVSEHRMTLPGISTFLADNGLTFRGFQIDPADLARFQEMFPGDAWPGRLEHWAQFEEANPHTFAGMYNFWCLRAG